MENLQMKPKSQWSDEERVQDFQRKIYQKAKQEKGFKFYVLYDKLSLPHFLKEAYKRVKANKGSAGVDGLSFDDIEKYGAGKYLSEIKRELEEKTYKPQAVKRVYIEKANGKLRPLGIPTIKDRIVQMACKMVIEPIFEADFTKDSYGFRPKKSAGGAMKAIKENLMRGKVEIIDADLSSYFDTIPHDKLMVLIAKRISDKDILHLIKMWLKSPVMEENNKISGGKKNKLGTPQGGVISPLLANIYLNLLDKIVNKAGSVFKNYGIKIVRYADDFVLMGEMITKEVVEYLKYVMKRLELKINGEKSRILRAEETSFDFLGFTIRYDRDIFGVKDKRYWNIVPSEKSMKRIREKISDCLRRNLSRNAKITVKELNPILRGWINYFSIDGVSYPKAAKNKIERYLNMRVKRYFKRKSQRACKLYRKRAVSFMRKIGLINPRNYTKLTPVNA